MPLYGIEPFTLPSTLTCSPPPCQAILSKLPAETGEELRSLYADLKELLTVENLVQTLLKDLVPSLMRNLPGQEDGGAGSLDSILFGQDASKVGNPLGSIENVIDRFVSVFQRLSLLECFDFLQDQTQLPNNCLWIASLGKDALKEVSALFKGGDSKTQRFKSGNIVADSHSEALSLATKVAGTAAGLFAPIKDIVKGGTSLVDVLISVFGDVEMLAGSPKERTLYAEKFDALAQALDVLAGAVKSIQASVAAPAVSDLLVFLNVSLDTSVVDTMMGKVVTVLTKTKAVSLAVRPTLICLMINIPSSLKKVVESVNSAINSGSISVPMLDEVFDEAQDSLSCALSVLGKLRVAVVSGQEVASAAEKTIDKVLRGMETGGKIVNSLVSVFQETVPLVVTIQRAGKVVADVLAAKALASSATKHSAVQVVLEFKSDLESFQASLSDMKAVLAGTSLVGPRMLQAVDLIISGVGFLGNGCDMLVGIISRLGKKESSFLETSSTTSHRLLRGDTVDNSAGAVMAEIAKLSRTLSNEIKKVGRSTDNVLKATRSVQGKMTAIEMNGGMGGGGGGGYGGGSGEEDGDGSSPKKKVSKRDKFKAMMTQPSSFFFCPTGFEKKGPVKSNIVYEKTITLLKETILVPPSATFGVEVTITIELELLVRAILGSGTCQSVEKEEETVVLIVPVFSASLLAYGILGVSVKVVKIEIEAHLEIATFQVPVALVVHPTMQSAFVQASPFIRTFSGQVYGRIFFMGCPLETPALRWMGLRMFLPQLCLDTSKWRACPSSTFKYNYNEESALLLESRAPTSGVCVPCLSSVDDEENQQLKCSVPPARYQAIAGLSRTFMSKVTQYFITYLKRKKQLLSAIIAQKYLVGGASTEKVRYDWDKWSSLKYMSMAGICDESVNVNTSVPGVASTVYSGVLWVQYRLGNDGEEKANVKEHTSILFSFEAVQKTSFLSTGLPASEELQEGRTWKHFYAHSYKKILSDVKVKFQVLQEPMTKLGDQKNELFFRRRWQSLMVQGLVVLLG